MRIGLIAERTGVSRDAIRMYEKMGLLSEAPAPHESNTYKEYSSQDIESIEMIKQMKSLGLTLKECKHILSMMKDGTAEEEFFGKFIPNKITELDKKIKELKKLKKNFEEILKGKCQSH